MMLPSAALEHWMREFYFDAEYDLGSSGVSTYSFGELREMLNLNQHELDTINFKDSLTRGSLDLRTAIANRWGSGNPENVMTANGSNEMLYHIMSTALDTRDEVIILSPIYHALNTIPETINCNIKHWKLRSELDFLPCFDELKSLITPKTKMVIVNFPHNPSGISITAEQQAELIKLVSEVNAYLVWDAAFEEMTDTPLQNPFLKYHNAISIGTLSKGYGLPGLRVGWCFAPPEILEKCVKLRDYTTLYISPLIEHIATKAIEHADILIKPRMEVARNNRNFLQKWIEKEADKIKWSNPTGGVTCLIKFKFVNDNERFCRDLVTKHSVMLVPGSCLDQNDYIRLGFGEPSKVFNEGLKRLAGHLETTYWN